MLWTRSFNLKVNAARQYAVLDPDLEIRGGAGGSPKKCFLALWASVWSKNVGGGGEGVLVPSPVSTTDTENTV